jgi:hypothetical protein
MATAPAFLQTLSQRPKRPAQLAILKARSVQVSASGVSHMFCKGFPAVRPTLCNVQVSLLVEQVDAYDKASSSHACLKGIRAEPQQPELPRLREALAAADTVVLLAEGVDVSPWGTVGDCKRQGSNHCCLLSRVYRQGSGLQPPSLAVTLRAGRAGQACACRAVAMLASFLLHGLVLLSLELNCWVVG